MKNVTEPSRGDGSVWVFRTCLAADPLAVLRHSGGISVYAADGVSGASAMPRTAGTWWNLR